MKGWIVLLLLFLVLIAGIYIFLGKTNLDFERLKVAAELASAMVVGIFAFAIAKKRR